jgi:hypothetical protein
MKRIKKSSAPRWRVTRIVGAKAQHLGELQADSAEAAIKRAIREFRIEPERQKRLAAYRVA